MSQTLYRGVLGVFAHLDATLEALRRLEAAGRRDFTVLSPVPRHEILDELYPRPSPVRFYSLVGGLLGTLAGFALASYAGLAMHRMVLTVSGKPVLAWPAYFVIGFELTVLFGALATMAGFLIHSRLPQVKAKEPYDAAFSEDRFGVFVPAEPAEAPELKRLLEEAGAVEVRVEQG
ncbi:MAG: DUF3341 domain-containing protein [Acidobacteria bacterium]|nr:DUF3341 domain-containing protein [Acidobacteriota bacterium]